MRVKRRQVLATIPAARQGRPLDTGTTSLQALADRFQPLPDPSRRASTATPTRRGVSFRLGLAGCAFKEGLRLPAARRRPVSESVDASDIIVSYGATDLSNAPRVTHRIITSQGEVRKLVKAKVYREVYLGQPIA